MKQRTIVIDDTSSAEEMISETLVDAGFEVVAQLRPETDLLSKIEDFSPDLLVIHLREPEKGILHRIKRANYLHPMPVVMFAQMDGQSMLDEVINSGVSAYVVDGLEAKRIEPIVKLAIARFRQMQGITQELADTKRVLGERKIIDRAKGIVMERRGCSEDEAYRSLRKVAMDKNQRIAEVAENIISAAKVFGRDV